MTMNREHGGLYTPPHTFERIQTEQQPEAVASALKLLTSTYPKAKMAQLLWDAYRFLILEDQEAYTHGMDLLNRGLFVSDPAGHQGIAETVALIHVFELWRPHLSEIQIQQWYDQLNPLVEQGLMDNPDLLSPYWQSTLALAAAVAFENEDLLQEGRERYARLIEQDLHAEGFSKSLMQDENDTLNTLYKQLRANEALVLAAEIASHAGVDLWSVNNRGVSIMTMSSYMIYYYFYPEKWHWESIYTWDDSKALFKQHGAFMEMVNAQSSLKGIDDLLADQRPFFSAHGGGLTTLTHGKGPAKKKRSWFR